MAHLALPNMKALKRHVRSKLESLRRGDLFMAIGLHGTEALFDENGDDFPDRSDTKHPFNVFMTAVAGAIVEEKGASKGKKKKMRLIEDYLHENRSQWRSMILKSQSRPLTPRKSVVDDQLADGKETVKGDVLADVEVQSPMQDEDKQTKKMKPSKKRKVPPQKSLSDDDEVVSEQALDDDDGLSDLNEDIPVIDRTDKQYLKRKAEFEKMRDKVLETIPERTKQLFGQVGVAKWVRVYLPALVLSPFSLPPDVRDTWFEMFDKVKAGNRVQSMTNMVYWYGSSNSPLQYSLIASNNLVPYEEAVKKGYGMLPKAAMKKLEKGEELTGKQLEQKLALDELKYDLKKEPGERCGYIKPFKEDYEIVDEKNKKDDEVPLDDEADAPKPKRQKKSKKRNDKAEGDVEEEDTGKVKSKVKSKGKTDEAGTGSTEASFEVSQEEKKPKTKKKVAKTHETSFDGNKKGKSNKAKNAEQAEAGMDDEKGEVSAQGDKAVKKKKHQAQSDGLTIDDIGDDDLPSDDDKNDVDVEPETESDEDDVDFDPLPKTASPKKGKAKKPPVKKEPPVKKVSTDKPKIKPQKELSLAKLKKKEQANFEECESKFRGLVKQWDSAIKDPDVDKKKIEMILTELLKNVDKFTAPFIEVYNLSRLMKLTKKAHDGEKRKELWAKMKTVYNAKSAALPPGFKVTVSGPTVKKGTKASPPPEAAVETDNDDAKIDGEAIARSIKSEPRVGPDMVDPSPSQANAPPDLLSPIKRTGSVEQIAPHVNKETSDPAPPPPPLDSGLSPVKVERKRFSLGNLLKPSEKEAKSKVRHSIDRQSSSLSLASRQPKFPTWMSEPTLAEVPGDENREFALEHLQQAAPIIPPGKHVNHNAVARSLEHAIYDWSRQNHNSSKDTSWEDKYWNKVHDIVAALCGNREPGTLAALISEGRIQSPAVLLNLSDDDLMTSFEGRPLSL